MPSYVDSLNSEQNKVRTAELVLAGAKPDEIAAELGVNRVQVFRYIDDIKERWAAVTSQFWHAHVINELAKLEYLEDVALEAFEQSKKAVIAIDQDGNSEAVDVPGDAKYLDVVLRIMENRAKRLKLYDFDPRQNKTEQSAEIEGATILRLEPGSYADTANAIAAAVNGEAYEIRNPGAENTRRATRGSKAPNEHRNTPASSVPRALRTV